MEWGEVDRDGVRWGSLGGVGQMMGHETSVGVSLDPGLMLRSRLRFGLGGGGWVGGVGEWSGQSCLGKLDPAVYSELEMDQLDVVHKVRADYVREATRDSDGAPSGSTDVHHSLVVLVVLHILNRPQQESQSSARRWDESRCC